MGKHAYSSVSSAVTTLQSLSEMKTEIRMHLSLLVSVVFFCLFGFALLFFFSVMIFILENITSVWLHAALIYVTYTHSADCSRSYCPYEKICFYTDQLFWETYLAQVI